MKFIEELLYEKTKDTKSEILFTQWSYDKKIIPKALNSIAKSLRLSPSSYLFLISKSSSFDNFL